MELSLEYQMVVAELGNQGRRLAGLNIGWQDRIQNYDPGLRLLERPLVRVNTRRDSATDQGPPAGAFARSTRS